MQGHLVIEGDTAPQRFHSGDIFRIDRLRVFDTPAQSIKRRVLIHLFQGIEERRDVLVLTDVHPEGDSALDQFGDVFFDVTPHRRLVDDDRRAVEILMVVQFDSE